MPQQHYSGRSDVPIQRVPVSGGDFVISRQVGHFSCPITGVKVFGPRAVLDPVTRQVVKLIDLPEPTQLPTTKVSPDPKDLTDYREVDFFDADPLEVHSTIWLAVQTGVLEVVPAEVMQEQFAETWAKRRAWCYESRSLVRDKAKAETLLDLFADAKAEHLEKARAAAKQAADAKAAAAK